MKRNKLINLLLLGSIIFIIYLTTVPTSSIGTGVKPGGINLIPFHTMKDMLLHDSFGYFLINNLGNIILFVPFGFMLSWKFQSLDRLIKVCLIGVCVSSTIEIIQLYMPNRWTDVDDVILNTIGIGVGYCVFKVFKKIKI